MESTISTCRSCDEVSVFVASLRACAKHKNLYKGAKIHDAVLKRGLFDHCLDALVTMYARCGELAKAKELLDLHKSRDVITWTTLIAGYAEMGQGQNALDCFEQMRRGGLPPNVVTFCCILKACGSIRAVAIGERIHEELTRQGLPGDNIVLGTALVDMYAKCGALAKAQQLLEKLSERDVVSWNVLIAGYAQEGQGDQALNCLEKMWEEGICPNEVTFVCILKGCGSIGALDRGEKIHDEIARRGLLGKNVVLGNALVDMYTKCGAPGKAHRVLEELPVRNIVSWNALIAGYAEQGQGQEALDCFERMKSEGLSPVEVTFICILKACGSIGAADKGEEIHDAIVRQGLLGNDIILDNALVDMYAKCGALAKAQEVLEELPVRDVVSWNVLITGYAQEGQGEQALNCFGRMQSEGLSPDEVTFISTLKACGSIGATDKGEEIHDVIARQACLGSKINTVLGTALVDMYAKCGALDKAQRVLEKLCVRNAISWNALVTGYMQEGQAGQALDCFERMKHDGFIPNAATFSCALTACSLLGLVGKAISCLMDVSSKYGMKPDLEHYTCLVDLLGRAGHLEMAVGMIQRMPPAGIVVWCALLSACRKWGDVNVGRWAFELAVQVDKSDAAPYILMADIYSGAGMQEDAEKIEALRLENKAWQKPAQSWWFLT